MLVLTCPLAACRRGRGALLYYSHPLPHTRAVSRPPTGMLWEAPFRLLSSRKSSPSILTPGAPLGQRLCSSSRVIESFVLIDDHQGSSRASI